ncbi:unnamed protein product, partial [Rotaria sordida]
MGDHEIGPQGLQHLADVLRQNQ